MAQQHCMKLCRLNVNVVITQGHLPRVLRNRPWQGPLLCTTDGEEVVMTKQCVFQLRRNALRNYDGKCQGLIASVIQNLSQCRSAHHIPMVYPGNELQPPRRQPPAYTLDTPAHSCLIYTLYIFHFRICDTYCCFRTSHNRLQVRRWKSNTRITKMPAKKQ